MQTASNFLIFFKLRANVKINTRQFYEHRYIQLYTDLQNQPQQRESNSQA